MHTHGGHLYTSFPNENKCKIVTQYLQVFSKDGRQTGQYTPDVPLNTWMTRCFLVDTVDAVTVTISRTDA